METNFLTKFTREYGILSAIGITGLSIIGYGLWLAVAPEKPVVEIIRNQESGNSDQSAATIFVDVAGAVEKPGVYTLPEKARIGDVLVAAGGISGSADRDWIAKNLNLAQEVKDGGKIYIPVNRRIGGANDSAGQQAGESVGQGGGKININTASQSELESLTGIGEARAMAIISNRPYAAPEEVVDKAKIPQSVYEKLAEKITVY